MTTTWAVCFPRLELAQIGRLWNVPGVEVLQQSGSCWLRGRQLDDRVRDLLRGFLSGQRFQVLADGQLQSPQARVPKGQLPIGPWKPLREWMTIGLPMTVWPGQVDEKVPLRLVRSKLVQDPQLLSTSIASWLRFGNESPQVRLGPLRFALTSRGEVLVQGQPLPSIEGRRFVVTGQIAVPAGWALSPAVNGSVLENLFGLEQGDLAVLHQESEWFPVRRDSFVRATRHAIRASADAVL